MPDDSDLGGVLVQKVRAASVIFSVSMLLTSQKHSAHTGAMGAPDRNKGIPSSQFLAVPAFVGSCPCSLVLKTGV